MELKIHALFIFRPQIFAQWQSAFGFSLKVNGKLLERYMMKCFVLNNKFYGYK